MVRQTSGADAVDNPVVDLGFTFGRLLTWFFLFPLLLWGLVALVGPVLTGFGQKDEQYVNYLRWVSDVERRTAVLVCPEIKIGEKVILDEGWTYQVAWNTATMLTPAGRRGLYVDNATSYQHQQTEFDNRQAQSAGQASTATGGGPGGMFARVGSVFSDRFFEANHSLTTITITRSMFAGQLLLIFVPWMVVGWFVGTYIVRKKEATGEQPLNHRYRMWVNTGRILLNFIPLMMMLPIPIPGIVSAAICIIPLPFCVALARANSVVRI